MDQEVLDENERFFGEHINVYMSDEEYKKLVKEACQYTGPPTLKGGRRRHDKRIFSPRGGEVRKLNTPVDGPFMVVKRGYRFRIIDKKTRLMAKGRDGRMLDYHGYGNVGTARRVCWILNYKHRAGKL